MRSKLSFALMLGLAVAAMGAFNKPTVSAGPVSTKSTKAISSKTTGDCCPSCPDCCSWDCCADGCCESCPDCCSQGCCPPGCCTGVKTKVKAAAKTSCCCDDAPPAKTTEVKAKKDCPPCPLCP